MFIESIALTVEGATVCIRERGEGEPPLLFLHGWADSGAVWEKSLRYWGTRWQVIALDQPGHGCSDETRVEDGTSGITRQIAGAVRQLALPPVVLVGHSFGGLLALQLALEYPQLVDRLVVVNPAWKGGFTVPVSWLSWQPLGVSVMWANCLLRLPLGPIPPFVTRRLSERNQSRVRRWRAFNESTPAWLYQTFLMIHRTDLTEQLHLIHQPTLILAGNSDRTIPLSASRELCALLPHARLVELDAGHQAAEDNWLAFRAALDDFLTG